MKRIYRVDNAVRTREEAAQVSLAPNGDLHAEVIDLEGRLPAQMIEDRPRVNVNVLGVEPIVIRSQVREIRDIRRLDISHAFVG